MKNRETKTPVISAANVSFGYNGTHILREVSADFHPGRFYGIIGPNGCGKTTFLDLLCGLKKPHTGDIIVNGRPVWSYSRRSLAKILALVPQFFETPFGFTAKEIVMMGRYPHIPRFSPPAETDERYVETVMRQTRTGGFKDRTITRVSGGERQRVIFARALAQQTPVLFLDEATANMDINHSVGVLGIVAERVEQEAMAAVAVFQDMNLAAVFCNELLFMKSGRIIAAGSPERVLTEETIRRVFEMDVKVYDEPYSGARQVVFRRSA
jgi:iron complex transport system ATP-binding protein